MKYKHILYNTNDDAETMTISVWCFIKNGVQNRCKWFKDSRSTVVHYLSVEWQQHGGCWDVGIVLCNQF